MTTPRDNIEAKLGLTGPPLQTMRDAPPHIPDHELIRRIGQGAYGEVWLARNALGTWRAVKIVYRDNFKDARPYEREFAGIRRFEPLSRSNEGFVDILHVGRFDPPTTDHPAGRAPRVPNNAPSRSDELRESPISHPNRTDDLRESPSSQPEARGGWFYYVMELADSGERQKEEGRMQNDECKMENETAPPTGTSNSSFSHLPSAFCLLTSYFPRTLSRDLAQRGRLPLEDCLELGLTLTLALGHLHRHGLIHRDIKPSNIIFVGGVPKLADIGLVTEAAGANTFVGTEGFVPPEGPTSPQADLYALGKVLYEAAMGKDRNEFPEPFTQIGTDRESVALMELNAVLLRACAPDPKKRYATAEAMHADLALLNSGGSVKRRHQFDRQFQIAKQVGAVAIGATLLIGAALLWQRQQTQKMTRLAEEKTALAAEKSQLADTNARLAVEKDTAAIESHRRLIRTQTGNGLRAMEADDPATAALWFAEVLEHSQGDADLEWRQRQRLSALFRILPKPIARLSLEHSGASVLTSLDGRWIIGEGGVQSGRFKVGEVRIWDATSFEPLHELVLSNIWGGTYVSSSGRRLIVSEETRKRIWDVTSGVPLETRLEVEGIGGPSAWSLDETRIATAKQDDTNVYLLDSVSGRLLVPPLEHTNPVVKVAFDPTGRWLVTGTENIVERGLSRFGCLFRPFDPEVGQARVWDVATGQPLTDWIDVDDPAYGIEFNPEGGAVAVFGIGEYSDISALERNSVRVVDLPSGMARFTPLSHVNTVQAARFSPDGRYLATASADRTVTVWNAYTGEAVHASLKHENNAPQSLRFSPDGAWLAAAGQREVRIWNVRTGKTVAALAGERGYPVEVEFSPDARRLIILARTGQIHVWDLAEIGPVLPPFSLGGGDIVTSAMFSPDGKSVCTVGATGELRIWDAVSGLAGGGTLVPTNRPDFVAGLIENRASWSSDGTSVAVPSGDHTVRVWDVATGLERLSPLRHHELVNSVEFSLDGKRLVTASEDFTARIWDATSGEQLTPPLEHRNGVLRARFSPDGSRVVTASRDGTARVWDAATGAPISPPLEEGMGREIGLPVAVLAVNFSPDGTRLAMGGTSRKATIRQAVSGRQVGEAMQHHGSILTLRFSPDGQRLLTTSSDRSARVWNANTGEPITPPMVHDQVVRTGDFSPDGLRVVTCSDEGTARLWDAATGEPLGPGLRHERGVLDVRFSPDGSMVCTASLDGSAQLWETEALDWTTGEFVAAAHLLAGAQVDSAERIAPLQAAEIEEAWRQVGPRLQNTRASADLAVRRHRRRMRLNEQARDWFGAEFHARRLVELQPGDATAQADVIRIRAIRPPAREPGTPPELVDLSAFYNASLPESWHGGTDNHLAELPRGVQWLAGTQFDVRGLIQVYVNDSRFPQAVTGIRISQKLERLQFLHASQGVQPPDGTRVGYYFVHFANGRSEEIPIIFGRDMCDWGDNSGTLAEASHAVIAWKGTNPAAVREGHRGRRLFKSTWENPAPDVEVTTIDFVAVYESANPFLVALTAESGPSSDRNAHLTPAGPRP